MFLSRIRKDDIEKDAMIFTSQRGEHYRSNIFNVHKQFKLGTYYSLNTRISLSYHKM